MFSGVERPLGKVKESGNISKSDCVKIATTVNKY